MNEVGRSASHRASIFGVAGFVLGILPLLALTFFSPGFGTEGVWGIAVFAVGVVTLLLLVVSARRHKGYWILVIVLLLLLSAVLVENFSDAWLYIGT